MILLFWNGSGGAPTPSTYYEVMDIGNSPVNTAVSHTRAMNITISENAEMTTAISWTYNDLEKH